MVAASTGAQPQPGKGGVRGGTHRRMEVEDAADRGLVQVAAANVAESHGSICKGLDDLRRRCSHGAVVSPGLVRARVRATCRGKWLSLPLGFAVCRLRAFPLPAALNARATATRAATSRRCSGAQGTQRHDASAGRVWRVVAWPVVGATARRGRPCAVLGAEGATERELRRRAAHEREKAKSATLTPARRRFASLNSPLEVKARVLAPCLRSQNGTQPRRGCLGAAGRPLLYWLSS